MADTSDNEILLRTIKRRLIEHLWNHKPTWVDCTTKYQVYFHPYDPKRVVFTAELSKEGPDQYSEPSRLAEYKCVVKLDESGGFTFSRCELEDVIREVP